MRPKCVLTGASGLLGGHVLLELQDWDVYILGKSKPAIKFLSPHCYHIPRDLNDADFEKHLPCDVDAVIHLAQSNHFRDFPNKALDIVNVNSMSTLRLLDYARKAQAKHFVFASSGTVYGSVTGPCSDKIALAIQPKKGLYYASKMAAEMFVETYSSLMTTVSLRFFFIYGPGQRAGMLMPRLMQSVIDSKAITLQGQHGMKINPIYVSDAAKAVTSSLSLSQSATINVAGSEVLSLKEIGNIIGHCIDKEPVFEVNVGNPVDLIADISTMQQLLMRPQVDFNEGIRTCLQANLCGIHT